MVTVATRVRTDTEAEVLVVTVVVVGPESDFEFHVMGVSARFGRMLKLGLFILPP